jgi:hypothetical protein
MPGPAEAGTTNVGFRHNAHLAERDEYSIGFASRSAAQVEHISGLARGIPAAWFPRWFAGLVLFGPLGKGPELPAVGVAFGGLVIVAVGLADPGGHLGLQVTLGAEFAGAILLLGAVNFRAPGLGQGRTRHAGGDAG